VEEEVGHLSPYHRGVQAIPSVRHGDLVVLPSDGHLLGKSDDTIVEHLDAWLPDVLGLT
jgi:hypothetical protein